MARLRHIALYAGLALIGLCAPAADAAGTVDYAKLSDTALVEALVTLDNQAPGTAGLEIGDSFEATRVAMLAACPPRPPTARELADRIPTGLLAKVEILPPIPTKSSDLAREIVRRGAPILPALLAHLNDSRTTRLLLASADYDLRGNWLFVTWVGFGEEYDPRRGEPESKPLKIDLRFPANYYARVGDLAYFLIGVIVNRQLDVIGYMPSSGAAISSPIERPGLAALVRADWTGLDTMEALRASLMDDARTATDKDRRAGAWLRLRHYFSDYYRGLTGADAAARDAEQQRLCAAQPPVYPKE